MPGAAEGARGQRWPAGLAALALAAPLAAAALGPAVARPVHLNFGPGDAPFVEGFAPQYEIDDRVATHWTTYHAAVRLPVRASGPLVARYRFARVFPQTARVEVHGPGGVVDAFEARGGAYQERAVPLAGRGGPLTLRFEADSHERQDRGLRMDWLRLEPVGGTRLRLDPSAWWPAPTVVALVLLFLLGSGWRPSAASAGAAAVAAVATAGLAWDPWLVHRLLRGVPLALALFGGTALWVARVLAARGRMTPATLRTLVALGLAAFLLRAAAVNHPDFYYPDLRTHARLVEFVARDGVDFFVHPSRSIAEHGVWYTEAYGRSYAFPYSPAFHLPFVALGLAYDTRIAAMKLTAAAVSVMPMLLAWALARRWGIAPLGVLLMLFVPTYTSRLSFAFLPSLFGHAVDVAFLAWFSGRFQRPLDRATLLAGALGVAACQLAYVSGVLNAGMLLLALAALAVPVGRRVPREALALLAMLAAGGAIAFLAYYRDFLPMVGDVIARAAGGGARASRYPVQPWLQVAWARTHDFFDGILPALAVAGLVLVWRGESRLARWVASSWLAAYLLLLLGRARLPDVFLHGHETLLATPLVCLLSGHALAQAWRAGRAWRAGAVAVVAALAVQGLSGQWRALFDQLGNAR